MLRVGFTLLPCKSLVKLLLAAMQLSVASAEPSRKPSHSLLLLPLSSSHATTIMASFCLPGEFMPQEAQATLSLTLSVNKPAQAPATEPPLSPHGSRSEQSIQIPLLPMPGGCPSGLAWSQFVWGREGGVHAMALGTFPVLSLPCHDRWGSSSQVKWRNLLIHQVETGSISSELRNTHT